MATRLGMTVRPSDLPSGRTAVAAAGDLAERGIEQVAPALLIAVENSFLARRPGGDRRGIGLGTSTFRRAPAGLDRHAQRREDEGDCLGHRHLEEAVILVEGVERLAEGRSV